MRRRFTSPHAMAMACDMFGPAPVDAEQMVPFCMAAPMDAKPLGREFQALAVLAAHVFKLRTAFANRAPE